MISTSCWANYHNECGGCACTCHNEHEIRFAKGELVDGQLVETNVRMIKQSDILKCPHVILEPSHYREDGSCKCDDPEERARMIKEWDYSEADFDD